MDKVLDLRADFQKQRWEASPPTLPPFEGFDLGAMPANVLHPLIEDAAHAAAESYNAPLALPFNASMGAFAHAAGRNVTFTTSPAPNEKLYAPNLAILAVMPPSAGKSTFFYDWAFKPAREKQSDFNEVHARRLEAYAIKLAAWKSEPKDMRGPEPIAPDLEDVLLVGDTTPEKLMRRFARKNWASLVGDEISQALNKASKGGYSGIAYIKKYIEFVQGRASSSDSISGGFLNVSYDEPIPFCLIGSLTPVDLQTVFGNGQDSDGFAARMLFTMHDGRDWRMRDPRKVELLKAKRERLFEPLRWLLDKVRPFDENPIRRNLPFVPDGQTFIYEATHKTLESIVNDRELSGPRSFGASKAAEWLNVLACVLEVMHAACEKREPTQISLQSCERAVACLPFYLGHMNACIDLVEGKAQEAGASERSNWKAAALDALEQESAATNGVLDLGRARQILVNVAQRHGRTSEPKDIMKEFKGFVHKNKVPVKIDLVSKVVVVEAMLGSGNADTAHSEHLEDILTP